MMAKSVLALSDRLPKFDFFFLFDFEFPCDLEDQFGFLIFERGGGISSNVISRNLKFPLQ
jgi:hypothetical protein